MVEGLTWCFWAGYTIMGGFAISIRCAFGVDRGIFFCAFKPFQNGLHLHFVLYTALNAWFLGRISSLL